MTRLLVDARPLTHPTAGGRGIGNHVAGLLEGLAAVGADAVALVESEAAFGLVPSSFPPSSVAVMGRAELRRHARPGTWFLATTMPLHPVSLDPIPAAVTEARLPVASLLYDVIPYRHPDVYLTSDNPRRQARLRALWSHTVDVHAANSEFVARTAVEVLGLDPARVGVTGAAPAARFTPPAAGCSSPRERPYVVAVTGADDRKNTPGLLTAWARVDAEIRAATDLVVVGSPGASTLASWRAIADDLAIAVELATGTDDARVVELFQHGRLGVFPSLEEGFGLPVLEMAACGLPVICSGTSSLPEVLPDARAHFDPTDPSAIARAIEASLRDPERRQVLRDAGKVALERWRWDRVAADLLALVDRVGPAHEAAPRPPAERVAVAMRPGFDGSRVPFGPDVVDERALGRYLKRHDLDRVITPAGGGSSAQVQG